MARIPAGALGGANLVGVDHGATISLIFDTSDDVID